MNNCHRGLNYRVKCSDVINAYFKSAKQFFKLEVKLLVDRKLGFGFKKIVSFHENDLYSNSQHNVSSCL